MTGFDKHNNFAYSTVAIAPSPSTSGGSLTLGGGDGSRFIPPFNATVWPAGVAPVAANSEIVRITSISTDTITIIRAQEGTAAINIQVGYQIADTLTAKSLTDIEKSIKTTAIAFAAALG